MENKTKTNQGRSFLGRVDADERARFSTYVISHLDKWRYENPGTNTWPALAERIGVSTDQISRWLKSQAVPSKVAIQKMCAIGVFGAMSPMTMLGEKPWMAYEPAILPEAPKSKKKAPKKTAAPAAPAAQPAPDVAAPEFEVVSDVFDVIAADSDISIRNKTVLSALVALARAGVTLDIDVKVRAR